METEEAIIDGMETQPLPKNDEYRANIKRIIDNEVKKAIELEIQQAAKELIEEHRNLTRNILEEYRSLIHEIVREEKETMAMKAEELKRAILKLLV
jgi:hypothetical protein